MVFKISWAVRMWVLPRWQLLSRQKSGDFFGWTGYLRSDAYVQRVPDA